MLKRLSGIIEQLRGGVGTIAPPPLDARPGSPSSRACVPSTTPRTRLSTISNTGRVPMGCRPRRRTVPMCDEHFAIVRDTRSPTTVTLAASR